MRWWRDEFPPPVGIRTPAHPDRSPALYHWAIPASTNHVFLKLYLGIVNFQSNYKEQLNLMGQATGVMSKVSLHSRLQIVIIILTGLLLVFYFKICVRTLNLVNTRLVVRNMGSRYHGPPPRRVDNWTQHKRGRYHYKMRKYTKRFRIEGKQSEWCTTVVGWNCHVGPVRNKEFLKKGHNRYRGREQVKTFYVCIIWFN
jgi:hypothetical protein